jgi:ABC-type uncharacterized transport system auxiliary subunit
VKLAALLVVVAACSGRLPETRYYQLATTAARTPPRSDAVLVVEPLDTDPAYDDERIVYRTTPYRLDYYQYHRWSAAPGVLIGNFLEQAFERSGRFRSVVRNATPAAHALLGGRVVAIEEVDASKHRWLGRIVLELTLTDPHTGEVVWSEQYEETEPMPTQHPEGLARAVSAALERIARRAAPAIADHTERLALLHADRARPVTSGARDNRVRLN